MRQRTLPLIVCAAMMASGVVATSVAIETVTEAPTASALNAVNILFDRPGNTPVFGPNEVVEIMAGNINYIGGKVPIATIKMVAGVPVEVAERVDACTANAAGTGKRSFAAALPDNAESTPAPPARRTETRSRKQPNACRNARLRSAASERTANVGTASATVPKTKEAQSGSTNDTSTPPTAIIPNVAGAHKRPTSSIATCRATCSSGDRPRIRRS